MKSLSMIAALVAMTATLGMAQTTTVHTQAEIDAHRAKIDQALVAKDYDAWKAEHLAWNPNDTRVASKVTAENFAKFAEMRAARQSGDLAKAQQLRSELGIEPKGQGAGQGKGQMRKGQGAGQGSCQGTGKGAGQGKGKMGKSQK